MLFFVFFFFKQKTAYDMRISDWSSDVCSSDLPGCFQRQSTCEIPQPAFGRIIIRPAGTHDPRMDGGDIDDRTRPARGAQILHKPAAREEATSQVGADQTPPLVCCHISHLDSGHVETC